MDSTSSMQLKDERKISERLYVVTHGESDCNGIVSVKLTRAAERASTNLVLAQITIVHET
ncbi:hypothetical protein EAF00_003424 [Botryotinia globosa]|nr:hypothetical protein EAF00_003424 [Botryotinia globosa]